MKEESAAGSARARLAACGLGLPAASVTTTMVRSSVSESRSVTGSWAMSSTTFEPGRRTTVTSKSPSASAFTLGFSVRLLTVTVAFGAVTPRSVIAAPDGR